MKPQLIYRFVIFQFNPVCIHFKPGARGGKETKQVLAQKKTTPIKERVLHNATQPVGIFLTAAARHTVGAGVIRV